MFTHSVLKSDNINSNLKDMLSEILDTEAMKSLELDSNLSKTQKKAFHLFKEGKNILLIGSAGVGKSLLLKTMEEYNKVETNKTMYLTSTTGISSYNLNGVTIHSLLGIGTGDLEKQALLKKVCRKPLYRDRIINIDVLVIDEASMLSAELFEKLDYICQNIKRSKAFFGGIQLVLSMDPLQLVAIFNNNKEIYKSMDERLIVESPVFNKNFKKNDNIIVLKENFRQKNDPTFINLLSRIRDGTFTTDDIDLLNTRKVLPKNPSDHVHLVSTNKKAQAINDSELSKIKTEQRTFTSTFNSTGKDKEIKELLTKELQFQFNQKGIRELTLKTGCRVMLIKNLDIQAGLVNGALGTITEFYKDCNDTFIPLVQFDGKGNTPGIKKLISPVTWDLEIQNCKGSAIQLPLMLAYSLTISKSQSLTLDSAVLDLSDCWVDSQVYVALSRLRSLDSMYLKSFNPIKITVNRVMKSYIDNLEK